MTYLIIAYAVAHILGFWIQLCILGCLTQIRRKGQENSDYFRKLDDDLDDKEFVVTHKFEEKKDPWQDDYEE